MTYDILALCSGGFDSIVMLHWLRELNPNKNILVLHFQYFQKNKKQEYEATVKVCRKLNCDLKPIYLPKFEWTNNKFYHAEYSGLGEYLEMRNMVFLSYALSVCESYKIPSLYIATLKHHGDYYYDTSDAFLDKIGDICRDLNIEFQTPFSEYDKFDLMRAAKTYSITEQDFFTCDNPVNDKPCGKCDDCKALKNLFEYIKKYD